MRQHVQYLRAHVVCVRVCVCVRDVYNARDHEREDVLRRSKRETERNRENAHMYARIYVCMRTCGYMRARVSAWHGVGAYGDPALDEWVENQGRSDENRHEKRNCDARLMFLNTSSDHLYNDTFLLCHILRKEVCTLRERNIIAPTTFLAVTKSFTSVFVLSFLSFSFSVRALSVYLFRFKNIGKVH